MTAVAVPTIERHASQLLDLLVDCGPLTAAECCEKLDWSRGRFDAAIRHARSVLCPALGIAVLRWQQSLDTAGDVWKLNNSYRSRYARLLAANEPRLADVFETRELRS